MSNQDTPPGEVWKDVVGYEGYYQVSDHGRIRSVDRVIVDARTRATYSRRGKLLKICNHNHGYKIVNLWKHGKVQQSLIHRLVLEAFIGPPSDPDTEGCHENGRRDDNHLANLRWDTRKGNAQDMRKHGTAQVGEKQHGSKLTLQDVFAIRELISKGIRLSKIARQFKVCPASISHIKRRKTWSHI